MSSAHTKSGAVGILGLQAGEDVKLHPEADALADVFGLMSYTRMTEIERDALKPGQLEAFERWRE